MASEGEEVTTVTETYEQPRLSAFANTDDPRVDPPNQYGYRAIWVTSIGEIISSDECDSMEECASWFLDATGMPAPTIYIGYAAQSEGGAGQYTTGLNADGYPTTVSASSEQSDVTDIESLAMLYQFVNVDSWTVAAADSSCAIADESSWVGMGNGTAVKQMADSTGFLGFENCGDGTIAAGYYPYCIQVYRRPITTGPQPGDPCLTGGWALLPDAAGMMINCAGDVMPAPSYESAPSGYRVLANPSYETVEGVDYYQWQAVGPAVGPEDPNFDDESFWTEQYEARGPAAGLPDDWVFGVDYPVLGAYGVMATSSTTTVSTDPIAVATAIERICVRGGLAPEQVDAEDVDQSLLGYGISNTYDGADCLRSLLTAYGLYGAEYDVQLHFHKLGEDVEIVVDPGEMIAGETQTDEATREQAVE
jgi:hypothetical protein